MEINQEQEIARLQSLNNNLEQENATLRETFNQMSERTAALNAQLSRLRAGELVSPEVEVVFIHWLEKHHAESTAKSLFTLGDIRKAYMDGFAVGVNL